MHQACINSWKFMEAPFSSCSDQRHCCIFKTLLFPLLLWSSLRFSWLYSQNKSGICPALSHLCYSLLGPNTLIFQLRYGNGLLTGPPASAAFRTTPLPVSLQEGRWRYVVPGISLCESHCLSPMPKPLQGLLSLRVKAPCSEESRYHPRLDFNTGIVWHHPWDLLCSFSEIFKFLEILGNRSRKTETA